MCKIKIRIKIRIRVYPWTENKHIFPPIWGIAHRRICDNNKLKQRGHWHEKCREREREMPPILLEDKGAKFSTEFSHHSARAKCTKHGDILKVGYSGPITLDTMIVLQAKVLPIRYGMSAVLERMDTAMLAWSGPVSVKRENYPSWMPPSAVIVPAEYYKRAIEYCALLGRLGVLRMPFLPEQAAVAQEWVDCFQA